MTNNFKMTNDFRTPTQCRLSRCFRKNNDWTVFCFHQKKLPICVVFDSHGKLEIILVKRAKIWCNLFEKFLFYNLFDKNLSKCFLSTTKTKYPRRCWFSVMFFSLETKKLVLLDGKLNAWKLRGLFESPHEAGFSRFLRRKADQKTVQTESIYGF